MNNESELPADVIAEIEADRKVTAIKLLREQRRIGLKEAKEIVDSYAQQHPASKEPQVPKADSGLSRIVILIIGVGLIVGLYKYFS